MEAKKGSVDQYLSGFPDDVRKRLERIRATIRKAAPGAEETISYRIPAFRLNGALIYFAAFKAHISLYPVTPAMKNKLGKELTAYTDPKRKGTVRFPLAEPIPQELIRRIVKVRVQENLDRSRSRRKKK